MTPEERDDLVQGVGARLQRELAALSQVLNTRFDRLEARIAAAEEQLAGAAREVAAIGQAVGAPAAKGHPAGRPRRRKAGTERSTR